MPADHHHPRPDVPVIDARAFGLPPVDMTAGSELLGAALAGCAPCQAERAAAMTDADQQYVTGHLLGALYAGVMSSAGGAMMGRLILGKFPPLLREALGYIDRAQLQGLAEVYLPSLTRTQRLDTIEHMLDYLTGLVALQQAERVTLHLVDPTP
jgi:branched-subunit amino acid ABC-type transport system permease component